MAITGGGLYPAVAGETLVVTVVIVVISEHC